MALNAFLKLIASNLGDIKGGTLQKGREGWIEVIAFSHEVLSPRDPATGQATGRRQHKPLTITKELDKSSPLLMQLLISNESIKNFELRFWTPKNAARVGASGAEYNHLTLKLQNAFIIDIKTTMLNNKNPELLKYKEFEDVSFVYENIEWVWNETGVTTVDNWV